MSEWIHVWSTPVAILHTVTKDESDGIKLISDQIQLFLVEDPDNPGLWRYTYECTQTLPMIITTCTIRAYGEELVEPVMKLLAPNDCFDVKATISAQNFNFFTEGGAV